MKRRGNKKEPHQRKGIYVLPNLITTAALFCGFFSIVHSIQGEFFTAAWAILFAGVFDALDGRVARLTRSHSDFGVEYDSLSDLASFGLAPAILAYTWTLNQFGKFGWAAAFLFFACGALRLARYNTQRLDVEKKYFQGLPIPLAAYAVAGYVIFHYRWKGDIEAASYLTLFMSVGLALLMVSNVRYRSFKSIPWRRKESFFVLVLMAVGIFVVASAPTVMIFLFTLTYVASGLVEELILKLKYRKQPERLTGLSNPDGSTGEPEPFRVIHGNSQK